MKELSELKVGAKGVFFTAIAHLSDSTPISVLAANSGAMVPGFIGLIESIEYRTVEGNNVPLVQDRPQLLVVDGQEYILANVGERPKAPTIIFDNGRTMTLGLLTQGQGKTTIHFKGDATPTSVLDLNKGLLEKMIGKTLKCTKFQRDDTNPIVRNAGQSNERRYPANVYEFVEVDPQPKG